MKKTIVIILAAFLLLSSFSPVLAHEKINKETKSFLAEIKWQIEALRALEKKIRHGFSHIKKEDERDDKDDEGDEEKHPCASVPPGHFIAPGWLKKHEHPELPPCQKLPPGIKKILKERHENSTTTPDTTAPIISEITATSTTSNSIRITWLTNEYATSKIWYSTSSPLTTSSTTPHIDSRAFVKYHRLTLSGLTASTTYYFIVSSQDIFWNTATSSELSLNTKN